jgi:hypothetical protein
VNVYLGFSFVNVSFASTSMDQDNNMKKVSLIVLFTYQDNTFVQLPTFGRSAIILKTTFGIPICMFAREFPKYKIGWTPFMLNHRFKVSSQTQLLTISLTTFTNVL